MWEDNLWNEMKRMRKRINHVFGFSDFPRQSMDIEPENYRHAWADFKEDEKNFFVTVEIWKVFYYSQGRWNFTICALTITRKCIAFSVQKILLKEFSCKGKTYKIGKKLMSFTICSFQTFKFSSPQTLNTHFSSVLYGKKRN